MVRPALLFMLLLFAGVASAQEQPRTFKVPFHTVRGMILLDAPWPANRQLYFSTPAQTIQSSARKPLVLPPSNSEPCKPPMQEQAQRAIT